ncbi:MAG: carbohydrate-binding protein, partial [Propionibacteriaceae bacterium]
MKPLVLKSTLAIAALALTAAALSAAPAHSEDFKLSWGDEFSGTGLPGSDWLVDEGTGYPGGPQNGFGTDEIETMTKSLANVHQAGGQLVITPLRDSSGAWTSGRIETKKVFKPAAGSVMRIQAGLALPNVHGAASKGYWPAFWAMGETQRANRWLWPANGEFDFMESVNGINKNWSTLHCGYPASWGGPCNEPSGISNKGIAPDSGDIWGSQHVYSFEWDRSQGTGHDQLRWYVDGSLRHTVNQTDPAVKDVWQTMSEHNGYFILLNVAMGGQFPAALGGGPDAGTVPGKPMLVDYVHVLFKGSGGTTPTPTATPKPTATPTVTPKPTTTPTVTPKPTTTPTVTPTPTTTPTVTPKPTPTVTPKPTTTPTVTTPPTTPGTGTKQTRVIQAESFTSQQGTSVETSADVGGGSDVTGISNGDSLGYSTVDFGTEAKRSLVARVASGSPNASVLVEVRLDSVTGPVIGNFGAAGTGGWQKWVTVPANINPTT